MNATDESNVHPHLMDRHLDRCPTCRSADLAPMVDDGAVHFLCRDCRGCWHVELGYVSRVDPNSCRHGD